jgi:hypothetical protein
MKFSVITFALLLCIGSIATAEDDECPSGTQVCSGGPSSTESDAIEQCIKCQDDTVKGLKRGHPHCAISVTQSGPLVKKRNSNPPAYTAKCDTDYVGVLKK